LKTFSVIAFALTNESNRKNRIAMVKNRIASNRNIKIVAALANVRVY